MNELEFEKIIQDPAERTAQYKMRVQVYYEITELYRLLWGDCYHFAIFSNGETRQTALIATEKMIAEEGGFCSGMTVLDVGCGLGGPALTIAKYSGANVIGVDIVEQHIQIARQRASVSGLSEQTSFEIVDAMNLPFPDEYFDGVYLFESACHMPDKSKFYQECGRVLRKGGRFVGTDWMRREGLTPQEELEYIEPIYRYHAVPHMVTLSELQDYLQAAGFFVEILEDASARGNVMRNWQPLNPKIIQEIYRYQSNPIPLAHKTLRQAGVALMQAAQVGAFIIGHWCAIKL
ncbi:MAG: methyltransferase domain-containing protein [Calothrix sp. C42_A2020_038]|nr:methyltransferase domain-containing protein [Calothrix sp. C42_A2020_038]